MKRQGAALTLAVGLGSSGCFAVMPDTSTSTASVSHQIVPSRGPGGPLALSFRATATRLTISVQQPASCRDDMHEVAVQRTHTGAHFVAWIDDDLRLVVFAILLAPVTIPVTALYTGIVVAASNDAEVRQEAIQPGAVYACSAPVPNLALELVTPDGPFAHGVTDGSGVVELPLDSGIPAGTAVRVTSTGEVRPVAL